MFEIETGNAFRPPAAKSTMVEGWGNVDWARDPVLAERFGRLFVKRLWEEVGTVAELDALMAAESVCIDALWLSHPHYAEAIDAAEKEIRMLLGATQSAPADKPRPAAPVSPTMEIRTMAKNEDFLKIVVKDVTFHWPRLDQPYRYNSQEKRTEPCAPTVQGAGWSIAWDMPATDARKMWDALAAHYAKCQQNNRKLPEFSEVFGVKKNDDGESVRFTAKKRAVSAAGTENKPPRVIGADMKDMPTDERAIWSGSRGNLRVLAFPVTDPDGKGGISLLLDAVQVIEAVYGGDSLEEDFGPVETAKSRDPFGDEPEVPAAAAPKPAPVPAGAPF